MWTETEVKFTDEKGRQRDRKALKPIGNHVHGKNSKYKCEIFTEENRKAIFNEYWGLAENYKAKKNFLLQFTKRLSVFRRRSQKEQDDPKRNVSYSYFFPKENVSIPVCKSFFCDTLCISYKPIEKAHKNRLPSSNMFSGEDGTRKTADRKQIVGWRTCQCKKTHRVIPSRRVSLLQETLKS